MENLARVIELWTKIPASKIREEEFKRLSELDQRLRTKIVGQDEAIDAVSAAIRRNRVGISPKHKPVKENHRIGLSADLLRELAGLVVAHVARGRADDPGHGVLLHKLRHIQADEALGGVEEVLRQLLDQLRL